MIAFFEAHCSLCNEICSASWIFRCFIYLKISFQNYEKSYHKEKYLKNRSQKRSSSRSPDYEKSGMPPLAKLHGAREKLRHISIKRESPETDSSSGSKNRHRRYQIPNDYDPNLKIKQEPIDDDYRTSNLVSVFEAIFGLLNVSIWRKTVDTFFFFFTVNLKVCVFIFYTFTNSYCKVDRHKMMFQVQIIHFEEKIFFVNLWPKNMKYKEYNKWMMQKYFLLCSLHTLCSVYVTINNIILQSCCYCCRNEKIPST